jgi:hypothetical protein
MKSVQERVKEYAETVRERTSLTLRYDEFLITTTNVELSRLLEKAIRNALEAAKAECEKIVARSIYDRDDCEAAYCSEAIAKLQEAL